MQHLAGFVSMVRYIVNFACGNDYNKDGETNDYEGAKPKEFWARPRVFLLFARPGPRVRRAHGRGPLASFCRHREPRKKERQPRALSGALLFAPIKQNLCRLREAADHLCDPLKARVLGHAAHRGDVVQKNASCNKPK